MPLFNCSRKKKIATELRYLESVYETLLFCSDFSKEVEKFDSAESFKQQLKYLYETNIEILEDFDLHARLKEFLTETEKSKFDEILARPRPTLELTD